MPRKKKKGFAKNMLAPEKNILRGPGEDCNCPVCVFSKSHAPGDPYDLSACPKWRSGKQDEEKAK